MPLNTTHRIREKDQVADIAVVFGDGIGAEIMHATLLVLKAAKAKIKINALDLSDPFAQFRGHAQLEVPTYVKDTIARTRALLMGPIGKNSIDIASYLQSDLPSLVDFYYISPPKKLACCEHQEVKLLIMFAKHQDEQTSANDIRNHEVMRLALDYASCLGGKNIVHVASGKEGLDTSFANCFSNNLQYYPQCSARELGIESLIKKLKDAPFEFEVMIGPRDIASQIDDLVDSFLMAKLFSCKAVMGANYASFSPMHGPVERLAEQGKANPSGMLQAAAQMLNYLGQYTQAQNILQALDKTIQDGVHTEDIYGRISSARKVSTLRFAEEVINRLN